MLFGRYLHVVQQRNLALLVGNDGKGHGAARDLVNVLDPALVALERVGREADDLDAALLELGLELGHGAELGGADGGVVLRVGEEHDPAVADELVEVDRAVGRVGLEVGGRVAEAEAAKQVSICVMMSWEVWLLTVRSWWPCLRSEYSCGEGRCKSGSIDVTSGYQ